MKTLRLNMELRDLHHEVHTPLAGSLGASQLLAETELSDEQRELVNMIIKSNERLLDFIDNQVLNSKNESTEPAYSNNYSSKEAINKPVLVIRFTDLPYQYTKVKQA